MQNQPKVHPRRRAARILWLFFSIVAGFLFQYLRARLTGRRYDFFSDSRHNRQRAIRLRKTALQMGGVLIKVGQFLSSRVDLLPTEYIEELALLQDEVPGVPFDEIRQVAEASLGGPLERYFTRFAPIPVAAASLGQVHRAQLPTGEEVAVKVQRPHIDAIVEADLSALRYVVGWLNRHTRLGRQADLPQILREFEDTMRLELNFQAEGHHAERLHIMFRHWPNIIIPRIYWSASRGRVLTMQYMQGVKVTDFPGYDREGISRTSTAELLMRAYLFQVLTVGFFHADPHPGNIFVRPGPEVVFVDFGMVGNISPPMRDDIRAVFLGIIRRDYDAVLAALARLGFIARNADMPALRNAIAWTIDTFYEMSFAELQAVRPEEVLDQLQDVLYTQSFRVPPDFAFLGRALGTLSGLCTALDPSFQFVTVAEPFARQLVGARNIAGLARQAAGEATNLVQTLYSLPRLSQGALLSLQRADLDVRREINELGRAVEHLERTIRRILYALLFVGFLTAGSFLFRGHTTLFAAAALIFSLVFFLIVLRPRGRPPGR